MTTTTAPESAATANARSRMATVRDLALTYGVTMDPQTDAANAALCAAMAAQVEYRAAWDRANAAGKTAQDAPVTDAARRNANAVGAAVRLTASVVSSVACGLHGVTRDGRSFTVVSTNSGDDYLRGVEFHQAFRNAGREVEGPEVIDVVRFFRTDAEAQDLARRIQGGEF